jgi:iron(III) transport system substrate-binding protein
MLGMLRRTLAPVLALVLAAAALVGCGGDDGTVLTVYSGRTTSLIDPLLQEFAQESGVDVAVKYGDSAELAVLIAEEGDRSPADVFISQSPGAIGFLEGRERLAELPEDLVTAVPERFRPDSGTWVGLSGRVRTIVYHTGRVEASEVPDSVFDLTAPEFRGRVGLAPTNGSFQDFISTMRAMVGDDRTLEWLTQMRENRVRTYQNNIAILEAVRRGEVDFGLVNHYYNEREKAENPGTPTENHFLAGDDPGAVILTTAVGVTATAGDRAEDAQRLVEFLVGRRAQEYFAQETFEYPLASGVEPAVDLPALDEIPSPRVDLSGLGDDLRRTRDLIRESGLERA